MNPGISRRINLLPKSGLLPQVFAFCLLLFAICVPVYPSQDPPPNIIMILADDLGWKDLSFNGSRFYETPNIDKLATEGTFFSNAYSNAPICAPSRAALLSGQYAPRTGFYTNHDSERGRSSWRAVIPTSNHHGLDQEKITLAEAFRSKGYTTMHAGKWHVGDTPDLYPEQQGFDVNAGGHRAGKPKTYFSPYGNPALTDGPDGEYLTDRLTTEAIQFIRKNREVPFFLYMSYYAPHTPLQAKDPMVWKYIPKPHHNGQFDPIYAAMIETVDINVGRLLESLDKLDLADQTIVVFFSDNGTPPFLAPNGPFRGYKGTLYEGGIRVPLIIRLPGKIAGGINDIPVIGMDLYPTLLDLAGIDAPQDYILDGISLEPLLRGNSMDKREALFWHFPAYLQGEYGMTKIWRTTPVSAVRMGNYKLLEYLDDGHLEMYDLENDPGEMDNLAEGQPVKADELFELLHEWRSSMGVSYPLQKNPEYDPHSIPKEFKYGNRSDIYIPNFKKKTSQ